MTQLGDSNALNCAFYNFQCPSRPSGRLQPVPLTVKKPMTIDLFTVKFFKYSIV